MRARAWHWVLFAAVLLPVYRPRSGADEAPLPEIIVTGSRLPRPPLPSADTVGPEELSLRNPPDLGSVLAGLSGIHASRPGGRAGPGAVLIRGGDPNFTLVTLDGLRLNDPTNSRGGSADPGDLAPELVERVDVVRGPRSAIQGADALAGVINITTRRGTAEPEGWLRAGMGRARHGMAGGWTGPVGPVLMSLGAQWERDRATPGGRFTGRTVHGRADWTPPDDGTLGLVLHHSRVAEETYPDDSGGPRFAVRREREQRERTTKGTGLHLDRPIAGGFALALDASAVEHRIDARSPGVAPGPRDPFGIPGSRTANRYRRAAVDVVGRHGPADAPVSIAAGVAAVHEHGRSNGALLFGPATIPTGFRLRRNTVAAFGEVAAGWAGLRLGLAARHDDPEGTRGRTSVSATASWSPAPGAPTLSAAYGEGFKLPSLYALADPVVGNANLRPETGRSWEAGVSVPLGRGESDVTIAVFRGRYRDLVDFEAGPPPRLVNRDRVRVRGAEMRLDLRPTKALSLRATTTLVDVDVVGTGGGLRGRPRWQGGLTALWSPPGPLAASLSASYVGRVRDSSVPTGDVILPPHLLVDVSVRYRFAGGAEVFAAIDNVLDRDALQAVGFPGAGLTPRLGLSFRF